MSGKGNEWWPPGPYIGGEWHEGKSRLAVCSPSSGSCIKEISAADSSMVAQAVEVAAGAAQRWRATSWRERARYLRALGDALTARATDFAEIIASEEGKLRKEALGEVDAAAEQFYWYAEEARRLFGRIGEGPDGREVMVFLEPIGVVLGVTTWNFPLLLPVRKLAAALAAGCSVILKVSEVCPLSGLGLGLLAESAGIPAGVVNVMTGNPIETVRQCLSSGVVRKVSFTGSNASGRVIAEHAARAGIPSALELGGHAPVIVCDREGAEKAAQEVFASKLRNAGQVCAAPDVVFCIGAGLAEYFVSCVEKGWSGLRVGLSTDDTAVMGPVISAARRGELEAKLEESERQSDVRRLGSMSEDAAQCEAAMLPGVVVDWNGESKFAREEIFGPVLAVRAVNSVGEAVVAANKSSAGLAAYVYGNSSSAVREVVRGLEVGMVGVNIATVAIAEAPFGGVKGSGFGREGGYEGAREFCVAKSVRFG